MVQFDVCSVCFHENSRRISQSLALVNKTGRKPVSHAETYRNWAIRPHHANTVKELRWLQIKLHLYFRKAVLAAVLAFKFVTGCAPRYLSN